MLFVTVAKLHFMCFRVYLWSLPWFCKNEMSPSNQLVVGIPYTAKLSRGKTFADAQKQYNSWENICGCIEILQFAGKIFADSG